MSRSCILVPGASADWSPPWQHALCQQLASYGFQVTPLAFVDEYHRTDSRATRLRVLYEAVLAKPDKPLLIGTSEGAALMLKCMECPAFCCKLSAAVLISPAYAVSLSGRRDFRRRRRGGGDIDLFRMLYGHRGRDGPRVSVKVMNTLETPAMVVHAKGDRQLVPIATVPAGEMLGIRSQTGHRLQVFTPPEE
eukprot:SAG22_NODE_6284_length_875_cov_0.838918_1_plen_192_part_10